MHECQVGVVRFGTSREDTRIQNILRQENITTLAQLAKTEYRTLSKVPNFGPKSIAIINSTLWELGLINRPFGIGSGINSSLDYKHRLLLRAEKIATESAKLLDDLKAHQEFFDDRSNGANEIV